MSRAFRHTAIYVRTDRVRNPADLKGKKVGVPEYQLTANVWARAFLSDDYGVNPSDIYWVRGGIENPTRPEKIAVDLPRGVRLDNAPEGETISALLERGEIDGFIAPRPPSLVRRGHPKVGWLFPIQSQWRRTILSVLACSQLYTLSAFVARSLIGTRGSPAQY